jgi:ubiquitin C-terminal hydrolase
MRYCGDSFLKVYPEDTRTKEHICNLAGSFVQMIMIMHQAKIIHSDIKHSNIGVVGADIRPFDMDCSVRNSKPEYSSTVPMEGGTYKTMAPEQICDKQCCFASDMWAVGLVLLQALLDSGSYNTFYERYLVALSYSEDNRKVVCSKSYNELKTTDISQLAISLTFCPSISKIFGEKMVGFITSKLLVVDYTMRATAEEWLTLVSIEGIKEHTRIQNMTTYDPSFEPQETPIFRSPLKSLNRLLLHEEMYRPGLLNISTDCFVNALIVNASVLMDDSEVLYKNSQHDIAAESKTYQMLLELVTQFKEGKSLVLPQQFRKRFKDFAVGQHDLDDFFHAVIRMIEEDIIYEQLVFLGLSSSDARKQAASDVTSVSMEGKCCTGVKYQVQVQCTSCQNSRVLQDKMQYDIVLHLTTLLPSIQDCLDDWMSVIGHSEIRCEKCKEDRLHNSLFVPTGTERYLTIFLKRFAMNTKQTEEVEINESIVVLGCTYVLRSFAIHIGEDMHSGHYVSVLRNDGKYLEFDDITVKPTSLDSNRYRSEVYMLVYEREANSELVLLSASDGKTIIEEKSNQLLQLKDKEERICFTDLFHFLRIYYFGKPSDEYNAYRRCEEADRISLFFEYFWNMRKLILDDWKTKVLKFTVDEQVLLAAINKAAYDVANISALTFVDFVQHVNVDLRKQAAKAKKADVMVEEVPEEVPDEVPEKVRVPEEVPEQVPRRSERLRAFIDMPNLCVNRQTNRIRVRDGSIFVREDLQDETRRGTKRNREESNSQKNQASKAGKVTESESVRSVLPERRRKRLKK